MNPRILDFACLALALMCATAHGLAAGQPSVRRSLDLIGAAVALALLFPLLLAIAATIKATSDGPVLVRSRSYGEKGGTFRPYEFRTDAGTFPARGSPQADAVGRFLRRYDLHLLPHLINVVSG